MFERYIAEAEDYLNQENVNRAYARLLQADKYCAEERSQREFNTLVAEFDTITSASLSDAESLFAQGEYREAIQTFASLSTLRKLSVGPVANARLREIRTDPSFREQILEADAAYEYSQDIEPILEDSEVQSGTEADRAGGLERERRVELVIELQEFINEYEATDAGRRAAELLHDLGRDRELVAEATEKRQTESFSKDFQMAVMYRQNGINDKAKELLQAMLDAGAEGDWKTRIERELKVLSVPDIRRSGL